MTVPRLVKLKALALIICGSVLQPAGAQTKLLRFPDIHGETVAFCHAGDIWTAPAAGGAAARLTTHPGQELFPRFSPDGRWIAFTGQYDGDEQVYVIPAQGGVPRQLTYYPARGPLAPRWGWDNQVYGWTPDGKRIVFRSLRDADGGRTESALYTVSVDGGLPDKLPMPSSGAGDVSPDGTRIVYSPLFRDFRTWKRYQGGWAQDLFIFDLKSNEAKRIAASRRSERDPMWIGDRICFSSDRDGTLNLYSYDIASERVTQLTRSSTWDVRWPSSDNRSRIVYELNGEIETLDLDSNRSRRIPIMVPNDGVAMRPSRYSAEKNIEDFELSPKGERALFVARGDVFTVPVEKGPTRNLTRSTGAHDRLARWSPDGSRIAFVSDYSGEEQVYVIDQGGEGKPERLTSEFGAMLSAPEWSADGKHLALSDKDGKLYVVGVDDRKVTLIADDAFGRINDYSWSGDGGFLAFSMANRNDTRSLYIWSAADGRLQRVTDETFTVYEPAWDPGGNYLYYLSEREFAPQISSLEWNFAGNRQTAILSLALRKDLAHPFPPESDEVSKGAGQEPEKKSGETGPSRVSIDFEGLSERAVRVPLGAENFDGLVAVKDHLLYIKGGARFYGRDSYQKTNLYIYDLKKREESELAGDASGFAVSSDGSKVLVRQGGVFKLYDAKPKAANPKTVATGGLKVDRVPALEWEEIFNEVWRRYRDFFYVRNMHGYDWKAIGDRYRQLLRHVGHRSDLNYVLGEMVSELNVGHAYIEGGDFEIPERPRVALPGARFKLDEKSGRYRIEKIFRGQNEEERYRAPLTEVGVDVREGEYVMAIDGEELRGTDNPYRHLLHKTNPVTLTVNVRPDLEGARKATYRPVFDESDLLYLDWVRGNQERVSRMTEGRVGYLHVPDMGASGIYEFVKWFYPQIRKEGLVIDVRSNGGGNVSQWLIERLDTRMLGTRFGNLSDEPRTYPYTVFHGHKVCLINETSASDGDIFPQRFRDAGLGPLIGKRTWGGVVGISGIGPLIDGGNASVPMLGTNDVEGHWIIEGEGVSPDIEVDNDPASVIAGRDPQLERGVAEVLKMIAARPMRLPKRPPDPVKVK